MGRLKILIGFLIGAVMMSSACYAVERIQTFDRTSFARIKAAHSGRPFVVVLWSLDCAYCEESLAALARIQRTHGIDVVTIGMDRIADRHTAESVEKKILSSGVKSEIWCFGSEPVERLRYSIDPKWRGEMPRSYWFTKKANGVAYSGVVTLAVAERFM